MNIFIKDIKNHVGQEITIQGWMFNKRSSGKLHFLQLRDGSGIIQGIVFQNDVTPEVFQIAEKLTIEASLKITGTPSQHPKNPDVYELQIKNIEIIQNPTEEYPIGKKEHGPEFLLDNRHLWLRSQRQWAIQRIRNTIINAMYEYLNENGFTKIDTPIFTPNACEGTTTLFKVPYFDLGHAYLSQTGQLYLEAAIFSMGRCFDFGPTFRAEKSKTRRHLTEFWMMDAEAAFVKHRKNLKIQEELICYIIKKVLAENQKELTIIERNLGPLQKIKPPFPIKTHAEIIKELQSMKSDIKENGDLGADDETMLMQKYETPLFVEKYPAEIKAFYMKRDPKNPSLALCADLLAPEGYGEIIGGSERENDYDTLKKHIEEDLQKKQTISLKDQKISFDSLQWYLELRKYGSVPHSGFGLGLERTVAWICGLKHIRETIPFPRMIHRVTP